MRPAMLLLPEQMRSETASNILVAIALQESDLNYRRQIRGPAIGFLMFEYPIIGLLLKHRAVGDMAKQVLSDLEYSSYDKKGIHDAMEHNDILQCAFARLLMWTDPHKLPDDLHGAWALYLRTWRPGKPHPDKWPRNYNLAIEHIKRKD